MTANLDVEELFKQINSHIPRSTFIPSVTEVTTACLCPRAMLLKTIYGVTSEYKPGLAIGTITHIALNFLSSLESTIAEHIHSNRYQKDLTKSIYDVWSSWADKIIDREWRYFASAKMSTEDGRQAVLERLRGFAANLGLELTQGSYKKPDKIITNHLIVLPSIPLQGVPDEYRIFEKGEDTHIEIREFKAFGGSKITEGNKLQVCAYQMLLENIFPNATFSLKVISIDNVVNVKFTDKRREKLLKGIDMMKNIFENTQTIANPAHRVCNICYLKEACMFYFKDDTPLNIKRYFWRLRMETLEESTLNQTWKWICNSTNLQERKALGLADYNYDLVEAENNVLTLRKTLGIVENVLIGDTIIVSSGNPLIDLSVTGEVSSISSNLVKVTCYSSIPPKLPSRDLALDQYKVDLARRNLSNIDVAHRATGRGAELIMIVLGCKSPRTPSSTPEISITSPLNPSQKDALKSALSSPDVFVVIGPPGTGKTTVISELIIQLMNSSKRVLVVSITNGAVDNIIENLLKRGERIGVRFGNWYKIRETAMDAALIRLIDGKEDKALAAIELMKKSSVVFTTCSSACIDLVKAAPFDTVIFEEASQVRMQSSFIPICQAERIVIFGDDKQLPPVSSLQRQPDSLLRIVLANINRFGLSSSLVRHLDVQYRMKQKICSIVNKLFYNNSLKTDKEAESRTLEYKVPISAPNWIRQILDPMAEIAIVNVESVEEQRGQSLINRINARVDELLVGTLNAIGLGEMQVGIVTPYEEQHRLLATELGNKAEIGTVDAYQGREKDVVILDLVRANPNFSLGFTTQSNRLNVALSRARKKLVIVMNCVTFSKNKIFQQLIETVQSDGVVVDLQAKNLDMILPIYKDKKEVEVKLDLHEQAMVDLTERRANDYEYVDLV